LIRIVIADDHSLIRQGIRSVLEDVQDIKVVGEAEDGHAARSLVERLKPDVLIIDINMPGLTGIQVTEQLTALNTSTRIVILSMYSDEEVVHQALHSGAKGYLLKRSVIEELALAIRSVHAGNAYFSPEIAHLVLAGYLTPESENSEQSAFEKLTSREREVLKLVAEGHTNKDIAEQLVISVKTVEKHRASVMEKLGVNDLPGLVRVAIKHNLIFLDD
jgi:two-component system, NarL family, response regulator NreC